MNVSEDITVERLERLDSDTLASLVQYGRSALGESALDEWLLPVIAEHGWLYVARMGDEIVGSAEVIRRRAGDELYLEGLYIRPKYQGSGFGGQLLRTVMSELAALQFSRIQATIDPENEAGVSLYTTLGFVAVDELEDYYGPGRDRILLAAKLGDGSDG
jgi:ribosomal protein S18 acetylase RimI-like enzyme